MADTGGKKKSEKEANNKKIAADADAKKKSISGDSKKGEKEVATTGKKDGKLVDTKKKSLQKDGKEELDESPTEQEIPEEPEKVVELVPLQRLCPSCNEVNRRWPPPPYVDPDPRDPTFLYPGDVDPEFQPTRGDIVVIHPGLHMGLMDLHRKTPGGVFVFSYDGSPGFEFAQGDLVLRMGIYDEVQQTVVEEPPKKGKPGKGEKVSVKKKGEEEEKKAKNAKGEEKKVDKKENLKKGAKEKGEVKKGAEEEVPEPVMERPSQPYHPYEKLELYTCTGFITAEEQTKLETERLAAEAEKEKLENESKQKAQKGKDGKNKGSKEGEGKKRPQDPPDGKKKSVKDDKGGKEEPDEKRDRGKKVPPKKKEEEVPAKQQEIDPVTGEIRVDVAQTLVIDPVPPKPKWRYMGGQPQLDFKSQTVLQKQCQGLTYFYRRYMVPGTRCDMHSLTPLLGEIIINLGWVDKWYTNREKWQKEVNKFRSLVKWYKPDTPDNGELIPGTILLRPMVGREQGEWPGWGLDGKKVPPLSPLLPFPRLPPLSVSQEEDTQEKTDVGNAKEIILPPKCDCHRKSPCPKPPCPCHMYDPCPKLPGCTCIYCNPLPRKQPESAGVEKPKEEETKSKGAGERKDGKGKANDGKHGGKGGNDVKGTEKDGKPNTKDGKGKGKGKSKDKKEEKTSNPKEGKSKASKENPKELGKGQSKGKSKDEPEEEQPEVPPKPYWWGAVEMYIFFSKEEGWEYWGRSDRICDTPYPSPSETAKSKFFHIDDRKKVDVQAVLEEQKPVVDDVLVEEEVAKDGEKKPAPKDDKTEPVKLGENNGDVKKKQPQGEGDKKRPKKT